MAHVMLAGFDGHTGLAPAFKLAELTLRRFSGCAWKLYELSSAINKGAYDQELSVIWLADGAL